MPYCDECGVAVPHSDEDGWLGAGTLCEKHRFLDQDQPVEMYVGFSDQTWDTFMVNVPQGTLKCDLKEKAEAMLLSRLEEAGRQDVAFMGMYCIVPPELLDPIEDDEPEWVDEIWAAQSMVDGIIYDDVVE